MEPPFSRPPKKNKPNANALGDILKKIIKKEGLGKKGLEGRILAQKVLHKQLGDHLFKHASIASVRTGIVVIEVDSSALFQEIEGYRRQEMVEAFRAAGMKIKEVRVRLQRKY